MPQIKKQFNWWSFGNYPKNLINKSQVQTDSKDYLDKSNHMGITLIASHRIIHARISIFGRFCY